MWGLLKKNLWRWSKEKLKKGIFWTSSHPIAGSEVSGPEHGVKNLFLHKWCILIKEKILIKNI